MRAAPRKMKQRSSKCLQTTSLSYSNAKSTLKVPLTFNTLEKTKHKNLNFIHLFSSSCFFLARHNSKSIWCMRILNIPNDCSANLLHSYTVFVLSFVWVTSGDELHVWPKTVHKLLRTLMRILLGFPHNNCVGVAATSLPGTNCV